MTAVRPRVLIAEDHTLVREGLRALLADEFEVLQLVEDGRALVQAAEALRPDLILVDISLPLLNGLEAARQLARLQPRSRIIFVTVHNDPAYVNAAFAAGADGYVTKAEAASGLVAAMREVLAGKRRVPPGIELTDAAPVALTGRQREILQLVAEGRTARQIGEILSISPKTVEFHKASIMRLLSLRSTADLTRYALAHGLIGHT